MMYGNQSSALSRLYKNGNRNLRGIAESEVPETLVNILAQNKNQRQTIVSIIEAIAATSLFKKNAQK